MNKKQVILSLLLIMLSLIPSVLLADSSDINIIQNATVSPYDAYTYIAAYKIKNCGTATVDNVVVICEITDGNGYVLRTLTQSWGSLKPGQEAGGTFEYYRPDKSFQVTHRLTIKSK